MWIFETTKGCLYYVGLCVLYLPMFSALNITIGLLNQEVQPTFSISDTCSLKQRRRLLVNLLESSLNMGLVPAVRLAKR